MFVFDKFARFLDIFDSLIFINFWNRDVLRKNDFLLLDFDSSILLNVFQHALSLEIFDRSLGVNPTIKHADKIVGAWEDKLNMVGDEDLKQVVRGLWKDFD